MAAVVRAFRSRMLVRVLTVVVALLVLIMLGAVLRRLSIDVPNVAAGMLPEDTYDVRFVQHHWLAYLHIGPGTLYPLGACLQLSYRFRSRHYTFHRRLGRVMIRAFAVGTIRIWLGVFVGFGLIEFENAFGPAFWISFSLHAAGPELWLRLFPNPPELAQPVTPALAVT